MFSEDNLAITLPFNGHVLDSWRDQMRKSFLTALLLSCTAIQIGCVIPMYSSSPDWRVKEMIFISEGLRHIPHIWERIWALEMPDVATPYRTHGGVI